MTIKITQCLAVIVSALALIPAGAHLAALLKERGPAFRPYLPLSGIFRLRQHDQRARQFVGAEGVCAGRDDQLAELLHLASFQVSRLVFE